MALNPAPGSNRDDRGERCIRRAILSTLVLVPVTLLAVGLAVASAESGEEVAAKTITTTLQPGDNFVGWVAEPQLAAELFAAFPQIELIYTWDPARGQYRWAHPDVEPYSDALELLAAETPAVIRIGETPTSVQELFDAEPRIQLIFRWNEAKSRWDAAWPAFPPEKWTLNALAPGMTAAIRIESETTAQDLFESLPQIDLISRYDQVADKNLYAVRGLTQAVGDLSTLTPGMGLVVRLGGEEPVEWGRQRRPAQGTVELQPGRNLVAWMGRDQAPLDRVVLGVGHHFERAGLWSRDQQAVVFHDSGGIASAAAQPTVRFGDALWVEVGRSVAWLQPTGILPEVIIAGSVSKTLEEEVYAAMRSVLDFYWERFAIEADFSRYQAYFPLGYDAFVDAIESHLPKHLGSITRSDAGEEEFNNIGGAFISGWNAFYVRLSQWKSSVRAGIVQGHLATAHEYTHLVQHQLSGARPFWHPEDAEPLWLTEGMARWAENSVLHRAGVSHTTLAADVRREQVGHPALSDIVSDGVAEYNVGAAAALTLAPDLSDDALFDMYRALTPTGTGPQLRWRSWPAWYAAFEELFGETVDEFYQRFESARLGSRGSVHGHSHSPPLLRGTAIIDGGTQTWDRWRVILSNSSGGSESGWLSISEQFEVTAAAQEHNKLTVEVGNRFQSCLAFWTDEGFVGHYDEAQELTLAPGEVRNLPLDLSDLCPHAIRGRVVTEGGQVLPGLIVTFESETNQAGFGRWGLPHTNSPSTYTDADGRFEFLVPASAQGTVNVGLSEGCEVSRDIRSVSTTDREVGSSNQPKMRGEYEIEIADGRCGFRISGVVVDTEGNGLDGIQVGALPEQVGPRAWHRVEKGGSFSITLPLPGSYRVSAHIEGCRVYYRRNGATTKRNEAELLEVSDSDISGIRMQLSDGMCELRMSGKLLNADGSPRSGLWVNAWSDAGSGGAWTGDDGSFSFIVPSKGSYRLSVWISGCDIHHGSHRATTNHNSAVQIVVSNADITGIEFRLPENPATFCD